LGDEFVQASWSAGKVIMAELEILQCLVDGRGEANPLDGVICVFECLLEEAEKAPCTWDGQSHGL